VSRQIAMLGGLVFLFAINADAQRPLADSSTIAHDWLIGASVGLPGYEREPAPELFTIGMNFTQMRPGRFGADFAIGTMPRAFAFGAGVLGARAGVVLPIAPTPDVLFLPSAGVSLVGGAGEGGGAAIGGLNAGAAMVDVYGSSQRSYSSAPLGAAAGASIRLSRRRAEMHPIRGSFRGPATY